MKILVIGSQGYLGTHLTEFLESLGWIVHGIDTGSFSQCYLGEECKEKNFIKMQCEEIQKSDLVKFDVVINLASNSNDPVSGAVPKDYYASGIRSAVRIAEFCKDLGKVYIFPSSCSVYGMGEGICDENSVPRPVSEYSKSKLTIEQALLALSDSNWSPVILRLATIFGFSRRMRFDIVINMFVGMLMTEGKIVLNSNGESWRPHLYIEDAVEAFSVFALHKPESGNGVIFNVGSNFNNLKIVDTAHLVCEVLGGGEIIFRDIKNITSPALKGMEVYGKDPRDYQVSFNLYRNTFKHVGAGTLVAEGIVQMYQKLKRLGLTKEIFLDSKYYRLRYLEGN